ncbi:MAG: 5'-nucleotidase domain-containing protein [Chlorobi bacterium OLB5]|nr:MAG: 5'-nucleotidase domain-containing protein [Chlorobi bacterium OLB5]
MSLYDLDDNSRLEIIVNNQGEVCVFNFDGSIRSGWPKAIVGRAQVSPAIGDIDNDGLAEIILATFKLLTQPPYTDSSALRIFRNDGSNFSGNWPVYYDSNYFNWDASPTLFLNKNNVDSNFILTSQNGETINFYEKSRNVMYDIYGNVKWQSHIITSGNAPSTLVMGDINRDGRLEFFNGEQADHFDTTLYGYSYNLQLLNNWPRTGGGAGKSTPIIGKFKYGNELSVLANTWSATVDSGGFIYGSNYDGSQLPWSPLRPIGLVYAISCADLNNDGSVELIAVSTRTSSETYLHIWSFPGIPYSNEDFPWPQYGHDRYRTNQFGFIPPDDPIGIQPISSNVPLRFTLYQNYPNPFNPVTNIRFDVSGNAKREMSNVKIVIFDILGRVVTTLVNEELKAGEYRISWDATNYSSGIYFIRMTSEDFSDNKKLILLK